MILTDSHAHLYLDQFSADRLELMDATLKAGVNRIFLPAIDSSTHQNLLELADQFPDSCFPMMGLHPCSVNASTVDYEIGIIEEFHSKRKFVAVGEIGIDLFWDQSQLALQQKIFAHQIDLAIKLKLPIVIHSRSAFKECYEIVKSKKATAEGKTLRGIFHCFSDGIDEAQKVIDLGGFLMGIGGVLTFKNSGVDKVVAHFGLEHFVLETDAPYLAPVPFRGKRNESAYLVHIATKMAEIKGVSMEIVAKVTTENSKTIFGI